MRKAIWMAAIVAAGAGVSGPVFAQDGEDTSEAAEVALNIWTGPACDFEIGLPAAPAVATANGTTSLSLAGDGWQIAATCGPADERPVLGDGAAEVQAILGKAGTRAIQFTYSDTDDEVRLSAEGIGVAGPQTVFVEHLYADGGAMKVEVVHEGDLDSLDVVYAVIDSIAWLGPLEE